MRKIYWLLILVVVLIAIGVSGDWIRPKNGGGVTPNSTFYEPSRSFELNSFADSCSIVSSDNLSNLSCVSGDSSFLRINVSSGLWSLSCCDFIDTKCDWYNTSNISTFLESKEFADNVLSTKYDGGYGAMCCNSDMSQCFFQKPMLNGSYQVCDKEYDQIFVSVSFNVTTANWSVVSCLDGFK